MERQAERDIERQRAADKRAGRKIAAKSVERQAARIPDGAEKIIMRPSGGLVRLLKYGSAYLADAILCAAGVSLDAAGEDVFSMNSKQHTILVATINAERKRKYADLKLLMFEGEKIEVTTYVAMPEDCGKGVVHEVPLTYSDADILQRLRTYGNPPVLGVRRLGKTSRTVLILFEDKEVPRWVRLTPMAQRCVIYRKKYEVCIACGRLGHRDDVCPDPAKVKCRGCGMEQPPQGHSCEPKCQLCGKGHSLGDRKCRELYRVPYEVKKKQWERKINMRQQQQLQNSSQLGRPLRGLPGVVLRRGATTKTFVPQRTPSRGWRRPRSSSMAARAPTRGAAPDPDPGRDRAPETRRNRGQGSGAKARTKTV